VSSDDVARLGGAERVTAVTRRFVDEMAADPIIGFLFAGKDLGRIAVHEAELALALFGAGERYTGRPLASLHRALRVHRGHFRRRLFVLRRVLAAEGIPEELVERWVAHHASMEAAIVSPTDCVE
jgi:truncated hemoglobin YjbI